MIGSVVGHDEPLLPLRYFAKMTALERISDVSIPTDPAIEQYFEMPDDETSEYYREVNRRAEVVIGYLQDRAVEALGHTQGILVAIGHTIWGHGSYYVDPYRGDVYEACEEGMVKRWTGVTLKEVFHVKPLVYDGLASPTITNDGSHLSPQKGRRSQPKTDDVKSALLKAGIDVATTRLAVKAIADIIAPFLKHPPNLANEHDALDQRIRRLLRSTRGS